MTGQEVAPKPENAAAGSLCAACYLTLTQAGFNPCDQSSPGCPTSLPGTGQ